MKAQTTKLYNWATTKAESNRSLFWLFLMFFLEIALFIPLDALLMFFCLHNRQKTFFYIFLAAAASTASALIGYSFGYFLWDLIGPYVVPNLISVPVFERFSNHLQSYGNLATFGGALLPFPLKALSLSAGVFNLKAASFTFYFFCARLLRFTLVGGSMLIWGTQVKGFLDKHFHRLFLLIGAKVAIVLGCIWFLAT